MLIRTDRTQRPQKEIQPRTRRSASLDRERKETQKWEKELRSEWKRERDREKEEERRRLKAWRQSEERELKREREQESRRQSTPEQQQDDQFKRDMRILEEHLSDMDFRSKLMATMWMCKLRTETNSPAETRARNIIAGHLVKCIDNNIFLTPPFNKPPPSDSLVVIREKFILTRESGCQDIPKRPRRRDPSYHLTKLYGESYDSGGFLSSLPVPRDGAFFVLHMRPNI